MKITKLTVKVLLKIQNYPEEYSSSKLSRIVDATYVAVIKIISNAEDNGIIIKSIKNGRENRISLTNKGEILCNKLKELKEIGAEFI